MGLLEYLPQAGIAIIIGAAIGALVGAFELALIARENAAEARQHFEQTRAIERRLPPGYLR